MYIMVINLKNTNIFVDFLWSQITNDNAYFIFNTLESKQIVSTCTFILVCSFFVFLNILNLCLTYFY